MDEELKIDLAIEYWWKSKMKKHWVSNGVSGCGEPHLINLMSAERGWNPLEPSHRMTVTIGNAEYEIIRRK